MRRFNNREVIMIQHDATRLSTQRWLLLSQWPGLSRKALRNLQAQSTDPSLILSLDDSDCLAAGARPEWLQARARYHRGADAQSEDQAVKQAETLRAMGGELICLGTPGYPGLLAEIPDPPPLLYGVGDLNLLAMPQIALVGSRHASRSGLELAQTFAKELARRGLCITSGLAYGVDAASHRGALAAAGKTIAVLGAGIDIIYPRRNAALYREIAEQGLLVSEFPPGSPPRREQFPQRNRVISGLSLGVLVVEAAVRSGSLITARFALEQGREVFAIPGSIHNPQARGCHRLIREGACLVESVEDIVEAWVGWLPAVLSDVPSPASQPGEVLATLAPEQRQLLNSLAYEPQPLDSLSQELGIAIEALLPGLMALELDGWVEQQGSCWLRCR